MKEFNAPEVKFVMITDDVVTASTDTCPPYTCHGYKCPDCGGCPGSYLCRIYDVD